MNDSDLGPLRGVRIFLNDENPPQAIDATTIFDFTPNRTEECVPLQQTFLQAVCAVPALVAFENLFFLLAIILYREKLKHHTVHRYVASAITANLVISVLAFYHFLNYYYGFEPHVPNLWWALRKGLTLSLSLVMCGNIGLLIYGIDDNTYIAGRAMKLSQQAENLAQYKRRKANFLIFFVWALPLMYGALSMAPWNCTSQCTCTLSYLSNDPTCPGRRCSRIYTPMSKSYLFVVVVLWVMECVGLIYLFGKSFYILKQSGNTSNGNAAQKSKLVKVKKTFAKWKNNYGILFILYLIFLLCSFPVMVLGLLDFAFLEMSPSLKLVNSVTPLPLLYSLISPFLIAHKLSGVKNALRNLATLSCYQSKTKPKTKNNKKNCDTALSASIASKELSSTNVV